MKDEINFGSWKVPELSDDGATSLFEGAKTRFERKRRGRKIAYSAAAGIFLCVVCFSFYYLKGNSTAGQMAELNRMLKSDVENNRGNIFYASGDGHELFMREVSHGM